MKQGAGMIVARAGIPAEHEPEFSRWYHEEHIPMAFRELPGLIRVRRFAAVEGEPRFMVLYEMETEEQLREVPASTAMQALREDYTARWGSQVQNRSVSFYIQIFSKERE